MTTPLDQISLASLPRDALAALAAVRCHPGVTVRVVGECAWVRWQAPDEQVLRRVLPVPGVELYSCRDGQWYRHGRLLPSFGLPGDDDGQPLDRVLFPAPVQSERVQSLALARCSLTLVPEDRPRATTGMLCDLTELGRWAETAPTAWLSALGAARCGRRVMLLGRNLPMLPGGERFWGNRLLAPLGLRVEPALAERVLLEALGLDEGEMLLLRASGGPTSSLAPRGIWVGGSTQYSVLGTSPAFSPRETGVVTAEVIPREAFQPLTRASVRLAVKELQ